MILINKQGKEAIFEQIQSQIKQLIAVGALKPDDKLPSVRSLAEELKINPNTVQRAYQQLEAEGVIYTLQKKGVFVSDTQKVNAQSVLMARCRELVALADSLGVGLAELNAMIEKAAKEE